MNELGLAAGFFAFVLTAVLGVGYLFERLLARRGAEVTDGLSVEPKLEPSGAVFLDVFRSIGENFPGARNESNPSRQRLIAAGYGWPSALPVFYGIKCGSALFLACLFAILALVYQGDPAAALLPMLCGLGLGFMLPDRVLVSRQRARARRLRSAIPAAMDLMVLGMEAGQSLDQSLADSSRSLKR